MADGYAPHVFEGIGLGYIDNAEPEIFPRARSLDDKRRYRAFFGCSSDVTTSLWLKLQPQWHINIMARPKHLLWSLVFLKVYASEIALSAMVGSPDEKTFRKWTQLFVDAISWLEADVVCLRMKEVCVLLWLFLISNIRLLLLITLQILWENRRINDIGNDCLVSVDGTDFRIKQIKPWSEAWYSYKYNGPGLRYEVGVCIRTGAIVWIHGPFAPGDYNDIEIFRHAMIAFLEDGERVEADAGYRGEHPRYVKIPDVLEEGTNVQRMRQRLMKRHETVNKRLKNFGCLKQAFRHDLVFHSACFRAVAVVTQLAFENGEPVFQVDYDDLLPP